MYFIQNYSDYTKNINETDYNDSNYLGFNSASCSSVEKVYKIIETNCTQWLENMRLQESPYEFFRGVSEVYCDYTIPKVFGTASSRKSKTDFNTLYLFKNLKSWQSYPDRGRSVFCQNNYRSLRESWDSYYIMQVIPFDNVVMGITKGDDFNFETSWPYLMKEVYGRTANKNSTNLILGDIINNKLEDIGIIFDSDITRFLKSCEVFDKKVKEKWKTGKLTSVELYTNIVNQSDVQRFAYSKFGLGFYNGLIVNKGYYGILDYLDELLSPINNKFYLTKYQVGFNPPKTYSKDNEIWFKGGCVMLRTSNNTYAKLLNHFNLIR